MLNGQRHLWETSVSYSSGKAVKKGSAYHRICPSYKQFSAVTNNGFFGISWFMVIPALMLVTLGILSTVFLTWMLGLIFFIASPIPHLWLIKRYFDSTPYKWEAGGEISRAESAYMLMSKAKQIEYRPYLDALFKGDLPAQEAKKLFEMNSEVTNLKKRLTEEIAAQEEQQEIMKDINKSLGTVN